MAGILHNAMRQIKLIQRLKQYNGEMCRENLAILLEEIYRSISQSNTVMETHLQKLKETFTTADRKTHIDFVDQRITSSIDNLEKIKSSIELINKVYLSIKDKLTDKEKNQTNEIICNLSNKLESKLVELYYYQIISTTTPEHSNKSHDSIAEQTFKAAIKANELIIKKKSVIPEDLTNMIDSIYTQTYHQIIPHTDQLPKSFTLPLLNMNLLLVDMLAKYGQTPLSIKHRPIMHARSLLLIDSIRRTSPESKSYFSYIKRNGKVTNPPNTIKFTHLCYRPDHQDLNEHYDVIYSQLQKNNHNHQQLANPDWITNEEKKTSDEQFNRLIRHDNQNKAKQKKKGANKKKPPATKTKNDHLTTPLDQKTYIAEEKKQHEKLTTKTSDQGNKRSEHQAARSLNNAIDLVIHHRLRAEKPSRLNRKHIARTNTAINQYIDLIKYTNQCQKEYNQYLENYARDWDDYETISTNVEMVIHDAQRTLSRFLKKMRSECNAGKEEIQDKDKHDQHQVDDNELYKKSGEQSIKSLQLENTSLPTDSHHSFITEQLLHINSSLDTSLTLTPSEYISLDAPIQIMMNQLSQGKKNQCFIHGGYIRDQLANIPPNDLDLITSIDIQSAITRLSYLCVGIKIRGKLLSFNIHAPSRTLHVDIMTSQNLTPSGLVKKANNADFNGNNLFATSDGAVIDPSRAGTSAARLKQLTLVGNHPTMQASHFINDPIRMIRAILFRLFRGFSLCPAIISLTKQHLQRITQSDTNLNNHIYAKISQARFYPKDRIVPPDEASYFLETIQCPAPLTQAILEQVSTNVKTKKT